MEDKVKKGITFATHEVEEKIMQIIGESKLPVVNIRIALQDIMNTITIQERQALEIEKSRYEQMEKENTKEKKNLKLVKSEMKGKENDK